MNISPISYSYNNYCYVATPFRAKYPINMRTFRDLKNVTCSHCGGKMLTYNQVEDYAKKGEKLTGKNLYKYLSALEPKMKKNEKAVLRVIKQGIKKYPKLNLQGVLQKLFPVHLEKLEKQQTEVLMQIANEAMNFSEMDKNLTLMKVYKGLFEVKKREIGRHFKLNEYLSDFYKIKADFSDMKNFEKIDTIVHSMPNTHNNIDAFIVKFSRKSSKEIIERLLSPSQSTEDHLLPKSLGGSNDMSNKVLACGDCNSKRGNKPLETIPNFRVNLTKYFRTLRLAISNKIPLQDCVKVEQHIIDVQNTVNSLLNEPIKFNNSKGYAR